METVVTMTSKVCSRSLVDDSVGQHARNLTRSKWLRVGSRVPTGSSGWTDRLWAPDHMPPPGQDDLTHEQHCWLVYQNFQILRTTLPEFLCLGLDSTQLQSWYGLHDQDIDIGLAKLLIWWVLQQENLQAHWNPLIFSLGKYVVSVLLLRKLIVNQGGDSDLTRKLKYDKGKLGRRNQIVGILGLGCLLYLQMYVCHS